MTQHPPVAALERRLHEIAAWLDQMAPYAQFDQRHLDAGTPEQAYWHLGYMTAMRDVLQHFKDEAECSTDISNPIPAAGPDV